MRITATIRYKGSNTILNCERYEYREILDSPASTLPFVDFSQEDHERIRKRARISPTQIPTQCHLGYNSSRLGFAEVLVRAGPATRRCVWELRVVLINYIEVIYLDHVWPRGRAENSHRGLYSGRGRRVDRQPLLRDF